MAAPGNADDVDPLALELAGVGPGTYGPEHQAHLLAQYEMYVEMADRVSARRQTANTFFLTVNTVLVAFLGLLAAERATGAPVVWVVAVAAAGVTLSYFWYRLIRSYRDLNSAKFKVVHAIERHLPLRPYDAEWVSVGRGVRSDLYLPLTNVEIRVPFVFALLYVLLAVWRFATALY